MSKGWHERGSYRHLSVPIMVLQFIAFILLLLVGLSLTIIKPIYLLSVKATVAPQTSVASQLRFGVWGVCASSALDPPSWFSNTGRCFGPKLGYDDVPQQLFDLAGIPASVSEIILKTILSVLILHLVGAGLALLTSFFSFFLRSHPISIVALITAFLTAIVSTIVFAVDLALVLVAKGKIRDTEFANTLGVNWGNGVWMVLVGTVLTWIAIVILCARVCYCCGVRPHGRIIHHHHPSHSSHSSYNRY